MTATKADAAFRALAALSEAIRELGEVPSGTLYAQLCGVMDLDQYESMLGVLKRAELISVDGFHLIRWVGPTIPTEVKSF